MALAICGITQVANADDADNLSAMAASEQLRDQRVMRRLARSRGKEEHILNWLHAIERIVAGRMSLDEQAIARLQGKQPRCERRRPLSSVPYERNIELQIRKFGCSSQSAVVIQQRTRDRVGTLG